MNSSAQIRNGAIISYLSIGLNIIAGLLYTPWMIQKIGRADYGLYALALSFLSYFMMDFGVGNAVGRYIAKYRAEGKDEQIPLLLGLTTKLYLLFDFLFLLVIVLLFLNLDHIFAALSPSEISKFEVVFCIIGLFSVVKFPFLSLKGILIGYEEFVFLKSTNLLKKLLTVGFMAGALLMDYGLYALVLVNTLVSLIIIGIQITYIFLKTTARLDIHHFDRSLLKKIFSFSVWVTVILFAQRLFQNITPSLLGIFSGSDQIAVFAIGMTIEGYFYTFASAVGGLFLPKVSRMLATGSYAELEGLFIKIGRIQLFILCAILIPFTTMGKEFINLWVGNDFEHAYAVALLLMVPGLILFTQQIAYTMLQAQNKLKYQAIVLLCAAPINIILSIALCRLFGAVGASTGICISLLLYNCIMNFLFFKKIGLNIPRFFCQCHLKLFPSFFLVLVIGFMLGRFFHAGSLLAFIPKVSFLVVFYILTIWLSTMNRYEKKLILSFVKKKKD